MWKLFFLVCILSLTNCAPSKNNSGSSIGAEETKSHSIESCLPPAKRSVRADNADILPMDLDPSFQNYIVKYKAQQVLTASGHARKEYSVSGLNLSSISNSKTLFSLKLTGSTVEKLKVIQRLSQQPDIDYVEPDYPIEMIPQVQASTSPNDPYFSKQWFHTTLKSLNAWSISNGSEDIVVAVIDTGVDYTHPDLVNNAWKNPDEVINGMDDDGNGLVDDIHGWNFAANSNDARSTSKSPHGSHVAGLIGAAGNNNVGVVGVAPKVKMMALKFMDDSGGGITSNAIKAIDYAIQKKVFLINNSWGSNRYSKSLSDAITRAADAGILFMAAAGNGNKGKGYDIQTTAWYPASYPQWNVFSIAASNSEDQLAAFSNYGANKVDVAAPGFSIYSTVSGTNYQMMSGTSMATPIVSGLAVLVKAANPNLDGNQILSIIRQSSDKLAQLKDKILSGGRVNSYNAVLLARAGQACKP